MRAGERQRLRLLLRELAALSAFSAIALTGTIPSVVIVLFAAALALALLGQRPLAGSPTLAAIVLLAVGAAAFFLAVRGVIDVVVAAASFASLVTAHRLLAEPTPQTDLQVLLSSLLLLAAGAALSGELWYGACLLAFAACACLVLGLGVVEARAAPGLELPVRPVVRQVLWGVLFAFVGGVAFFFLFPRLSWNVAARRTPPGILGASAGMTDRVRLGGDGTIKTSARAVALVELVPDPKVERLDRYWVGRHFDTFDGVEWRGAGVSKAPASAVQITPHTSRNVQQRIELLPGYGAQTLIALERPLRFEAAHVLSARGQASALLQEVSAEEVRVAQVGSAYRYLASSAEPADAEAAARAREGAEAPVDPARYLQLPANLDPRIAELAGRVAAGEVEPERVALRLQRYLSREYAYTLELEGAPTDPLAYFLFVRKAGHCEHFASALAVMLRSLGIPARVTGGFFGGHRVQERYAIRSGDAHAWTQVHLPKRGWVSLDATPDDGRRAQPSAVWARVVALYESLEELWRRRVIDYSLQDQVELARALVRPPRSAIAGGASSAVKIPWRAVATAAGAVALVLLSVALVRRHPARRAHPATAFLAALERRLEAAHVGRLEGEGIEELSARLAGTDHPIAAPLDVAVRRYLAARFGGRPLAAHEAQRLLGALTRASEEARALHIEPGPPRPLERRAG